MRATIRFLRRGRMVELHDVPPTRTLLDYLRLEEKSRGTKEGCNEGDCGACTVVLGTPGDGRVIYEAVNACILMLGQIDGKELVTVDDLAREGALHPVQQAMVDFHASQCGFCTPGFVMSLFALSHRGRVAGRADVLDAIAGNLCRCTGYRPIVDAALHACDGQAEDDWGTQETAQQLQALADGEDIFIGSENSFFAAPASPESLATLAAAHPDATILAGATDVGLWITKQMRALPKIIHIGRVKALHGIVETSDTLSIGAAATYAEALSHLAGLSPNMGEVLRRIGSAQVRASGTVGGNIANGSPIGDMPPMLIALDATLTLRHGDAEHSLALEDFFIAYGKQDRKPGELVWRIDVPKLKGNERFFAFKLSKRFDQDISAIMAAFRFTVEADHIASARVAFGGMAATPKRAAHTEAALAGLSLHNAASWAAAEQALAEDFQPIGDMRASAAYRIEAAKGLLRRALMECAGRTPAETRIRIPA
ncbi:xanthine dehydrogenase small subunit [Aestuariivirga sp.]|uniref:xanthine dehydrogenase small subunit n=1 Tax=Aestuariivirga sp. TaxID=2650926 RepID=UPI0039E51C99